MVNRDKCRRLYDAVREILFRQWDALGVNDIAPDDEYDCCVPAVVRLLEKGADVEQIADHLEQQAGDHLGLCLADWEQCCKVAQLLRQLVEVEGD